MPRRASQSKRLGPDSARKKNQGQETLERAAKAVDGASKRSRIPALRPLGLSSGRRGTCQEVSWLDKPRNLVATAEQSEHVSKSAQRAARSEEHTSELQSRVDLVCRLLLEKKKHRVHSS